MKSKSGNQTHLWQQLYAFAVWLILIPLLTLSACQPQEQIESSKKAIARDNFETIAYGLKGGKPYAGTKLTFLICCSDTPQFIAWKQRTKEFSELTGIEVEYAWEPWGSFKEKIATEGVVKTGEYDIVLWLDSWGPSFDYFLLPLSDRLAAEKIDLQQFPQVYVNSVTLNKEVRGLPVRGHPQMLFYRQDILEELNLKPPQTWAELETVGKTITRKTDLYGIASYYGTQSNGQNLFVWMNYLWSNGSEVFDENYRPMFNSSAGIEATQRYVDLLLKHKIAPPSSVTYNEAEGARSVAQGESAMVITWWWRYAGLTDKTQAASEVAGNIGFAPPPGWESKQTVNYALQLPVGISAYSKYPDAAWEYLKWLTHPETERGIVLDKSNPKTSTIVAVHQANLLDPEVNKTSNGLHQTGARVLENSRLTPLIAEWTEVSTVLEVAINNIASGSNTKATLDRAAREITEIMKRAGYY